MPVFKRVALGATSTVYWYGTRRFEFQGETLQIPEDDVDGLAWFRGSSVNMA